MPPAKVILVCALVAVTYFYGAKPVKKVAVKTKHAIVHVVTLGKK